MGKFFAILGICFLSSTVVFSNDEEAHYIPKLGGTLTSLLTNNLSTDTKLGFYGGIGIDDFRMEFFALQLNIAYQQKGAIIQKEDAYTLPLNYLSFDFVINPYIYFNDFFRINLYAGPFLDILLSSDGLKYMELNKTNFRTYDAGVTAGFGFEIKQVVFDFKFNRGILNLDKTKKSDIYSNLFYFVIGYRIRGSEDF